MLPFFSILVLIGFVAFYSRNGRPIDLRLKGLGITFELRSSKTDKGVDNAQQIG